MGDCTTLARQTFATPWNYHGNTVAEIALFHYAPSLACQVSVSGQWYRNLEARVSHQERSSHSPHGLQRIVLQRGQTTFTTSSINTFGSLTGIEPIQISVYQFRIVKAPVVGFSNLLPRHSMSAQ